MSGSPAWTRPARAGRSAACFASSSPKPAATTTSRTPSRSPHSRAGQRYKPFKDLRGARAGRDRARASGAIPSGSSPRQACARRSGSRLSHGDVDEGANRHDPPHLHRRQGPRAVRRKDLRFDPHHPPFRSSDRHVPMHSALDAGTRTSSSRRRAAATSTSETGAHRDWHPALEAAGVDHGARTRFATRSPPGFSCTPTTAGSWPS